MKSKSRMARSIFSLFLVFSMILISFPTNAVVTSPLIPGEVGSLDNPGDVKIEKFAETTSTENEFKVTVTVEGKEKIDAAETDIVLVLDKSGSMAGSKMTAAKNTAKDFINTLLPSGNTVNRIGLVTFSDNASMVQALTNSAGSSSTGLIKAINDINTGGGTYIQKALVIAQGMLTGSTADHQYIVLLSDGAPTLSTQALTAVASTDIPGLSFKLTSFNNTKLGGSGTSYIINPPYNVNGYSVGNHGIPTLSQASIIKDADIEIFSIGFGLSGTTNNATVSDATWVLQNIANNGNYYPAADAEDLIDAFDSIAGEIIAPVKNGLVTDPIGEMYTYVPGSATASQGSAAYDNSTKTLTWTLGTVPEGVQATMTYHLQMNVTDPLFESDVIYPLNGTTTLAFTNVDGQSDSMDFLLPQASGKASPIPVILTTSVVGSGTINPVSGDHDYAPGTTATITATPASGWEFDRWNDAEGYTVPNASGEVLMDLDRKVEAIFKEIVNPPADVTLTTSVVGSGTISPSTGDHDYAPGTTATVTATPASGWEFDRWNDADGFTVPNASGEVLMDTDRKVEAIFVESEVPPVYVTLATSIIGSGSINPSTGDHDYPIGTTVVVTANPTSGWEFDRWNDAEGYSVPNVSGEVLMDTDKKVEAIFIESTPPEGLSVKIIKFRDNNKDGIMNGSDSRLDGIQFKLEQSVPVESKSEMVTNSIPYAMTLTTGEGDFATGEIVFDDLAPGYYTLTEMSRHQITTPDELKAGEMSFWIPENGEEQQSQQLVIIVGNYWRKPSPNPDPEPVDPKGEITINKFLDANMDGFKDENELMLPGIKFELYNANKILIPTSSTLTNESGLLTFSNLEYGTYYIREINSDFFVTTGNIGSDGFSDPITVDSTSKLTLSIGNARIVEVVEPVVEDIEEVVEEDIPLDAPPLAELPKTGEVPPYTSYVFGSLLLIMGTILRRKSN